MANATVEDWRDGVNAGQPLRMREYVVNTSGLSQAELDALHTQWEAEDRQQLAEAILTCPCGAQRCPRCDQLAQQLAHSISQPLGRPS